MGRRGWIGIEVALDDDQGAYRSDRCCAVLCNPVQCGLLFFLLLLFSTLDRMHRHGAGGATSLPLPLPLPLSLSASATASRKGMPISQVEDDGAMDIMGERRKERNINFGGKHGRSSSTRSPLGAH